ncbi:MAG TPA: O-antigen ligase family protein [Steroidobacteraceae bacterium]|nr:O-antigen ligase family protein [Steroidobacteraceae bacterium]
MRLLFVLLIGTLAASDIFQTGMSIGPGLSIKNAILYPLALGLMFRMALTGRYRMKLPIVNLAFIVWTVYAVLTWIACFAIIKYPGYEPLPSFIELKSVLIDSALFFFTFFYGTEGEPDFLLMGKTLALAIGLANFLTLADLAGVVHLGITVGQSGVEADRVFGVFGHANDTGALIVCLLPLCVAVAVSSKGALKALWFIGALASLAVLILTISRSAYVGFVLGYAWAVWLCRRYLPTSRIVSWSLVGATCIVVAGGVAAMLIPSMTEVLMDRVFNQSMSASLSVASSGRTTIWLGALSTMMAHPLTLLTGFGWRVYQTMFVLVTHNYYLDQWFGLGLIGVICFLTILYQSVMTARAALATASPAARPYLMAFIFGILGLSICLFFDNLDKPWSYVWVYVGFSLRFAADVTEEARKSAVAAPAAPRPAYSPNLSRRPAGRRVVGGVRR